jgi:hypothetical protein
MTNHRLNAVARVTGYKPCSGQRQAKMDSTIYFEVLVLIDILLGDVFRFAMCGFQGMSISVPK